MRLQILARPPAGQAVSESYGYTDHWVADPWNTAWKTWADGRFKGLRARGGFEVDIEWKHCKLVRTKVRSLLGKPCNLRYGNVVRRFSLKKGEEKIWTAQ